MDWFWLTIGYIICLVIAELINKKALTVQGMDELVFGASVQLATGVICLFLAIVFGWQYTFTPTSIVLILGMIVTYIVAVSLFYTGLKRVDVSTTAVLGSVGSVWSFLLGTVLLGESFLPVKIIGIVGIFLSIVVVSLDGNRIQIGKYTLIILFSTFFYALGAVFDKQLNTFGNPFSYIALSFSVVGVLMLIVYFPRTINAFHETFRKSAYWKSICINGILYTLGFWCLFEAYNRGGEVSRVFPMSLSTSVIIPIAGVVVLKEYKRVMFKFLAACILAVGLVFISRTS